MPPIPPRRSWIPLALVAWAGATALVLVAPSLFTHGLRAEYFYGGHWTDTPRLVSVEAWGADDWVEQQAQRYTGRMFSARWTGWIEVPEPDTYRFATESDDGSWLYVDDRLVVDNGGEHPLQAREGRIELTAGLHRVRIDYFQASRGTGLFVRWAQGERDLVPISARSLFPTRRARVFTTVATPAYLWATLMSSALLLAALGWGIARVRRHTRDYPRDVALNAWLWGVLGLAFGLVVWQVWYGLPIGAIGWEGDELRARDIVPALDLAFAHGFYDHYPPGYFYVLGLLTLPFSVAAWAGALDLWTDQVTMTLAAVYRGTAVLSGLAIVYLTYRCALEAFGRRGAAIWAAFAAAVIPNFVYLAKLAKPEVPYLAPFMAAMLYYVRALRDPRPAQYGAFALWGMVAICVKDQAYGLFVLPALHLIWLRWRAAEGSAGRRVLALVADRALFRAVVASVVTFVVIHNLLFNLAGFAEHLKLITGDGSQGFARYAPTVPEHVRMLRDGLLMVPWMLGWPLALLAAAGVVIAWRQRRDATVALLLPAVSYYVTFIAVIRYQYDRFYLGPAILFAVFAGLTLATLARQAVWARLVAVGVAAFSLVNGASVNLLMARDSRYDAEAWLHAHVSDALTIGYIGPLAYLPRLDGYRQAEVPPEWETVNLVAPDYLVLNAEFARRPRFYDFYRPLFEGMQPAYELAATFKSPPGPAILAHARLFNNGVEDEFTNLDKINPEIVIFKRR